MEPGRKGPTPVMAAPLRERLTWGVRTGLAFALIFSLFAVVLYAVAGQEVFRSKGMSLAATVLLYVFAGIVGGTVAGALLPAVRWRLGAAGVGTLVMLPVMSVTVEMVSGPTPWNAIMALLVLAYSVLVGGGTGLIYRAIFASEVRAAARARQRTAKRGKSRDST